jgi:hypothetical protein
MKYRLSNVVVLEQNLKNEEIDQVINDLKLDPNLIMGGLGGLATSFLIVLLWLSFTNISGYPASVFIIINGLLVGKSIRISGAGFSQWFGIVAIMLVLFTGLLGIVVSSLGLIAHQQHKSLSEVFSWLSFNASLEVLFENINPLRIFYLIVAGFTGYRLAMKNA